MFLIVPLIIFVVSLVLGIWLIARKFVYLKKLTPEAISSDVLVTHPGFWVEFFPEIDGWVKKMNWQEYKVNFLAEFEKFLRKFRLVFLKIETLNSKLIHRVRKTTIEQGEVLNEKVAEEAQRLETIKVEAEERKDEQTDLKEREHNLIIEIAKDPKNGELYKSLGKLYVEIKNWEDALESFKKAVELNSKDEEARAELERVSKKIMEGLPSSSHGNG